MRADGTAANKAAAGGPCATQANTMSIATHDADTFSAADVINLCDDGGTYTDQMDIPSSGTSDDQITYQNASGDSPIISGSDTRASAIAGTDKDFITITGLNLIAWEDYGINNQHGEGWIVDNNTITSGDETVPVVGILFEGESQFIRIVDGGTISNNMISNINGSTPARTTVVVGGGSTTYFVGIAAFQVDAATISSNTIHDSDALGILCRSSTGGVQAGNVIESNIMHGVNSGINVTLASSTIIRYNLIRDGIAAGIALNVNSDDSEIYYNMIHGLTIESVQSWNGIDINQATDDTLVYNNTVACVVQGNQTVEHSTTDSLRTALKNNIYDASCNFNFSNPALTTRFPITINEETGKGTIGQNNLLWPTTTDEAADKVARTHVPISPAVYYTLTEWQAFDAELLGVNSLDSDPLFVNRTDTFVLTRTSPAIFAGQDLSLTRDFLGQAIRDSANPNMGAIESWPKIW